MPEINIMYTVETKLLPAAAHLNTKLYKHKQSQHSLYKSGIKYVLRAEHKKTQQKLFFWNVETKKIKYVQLKF